MHPNKATLSCLPKAYQYSSDKQLVSKDRIALGGNSLFHHHSWRRADPLEILKIIVRSVASAVSTTVFCSVASAMLTLVNGQSVDCGSGATSSALRSSSWQEGDDMLFIGSDVCSSIDIQESAVANSFKRFC
jgi:hypothetical protein